MKRKLFIGSSREGLSVAEKVKSEIQKECGDWIEPVIWENKNLFKQNRSILQNLVNFSRRFDYGIFVATADDVSFKIKRKQIGYSMRNNVLFESGLFLGSLGLNRAFLLVERKCPLPSDFAGTIVAKFDSKKKSSIEYEINKIIDALKASRTTYKFSIIPSTALAVGYFESYIKKVADIKLQYGIVDYSVTIYLPLNIANIGKEIELYLLNSKSKSVSLKKNEDRPTVFEKPNGDIWDIPTTLNTLNYIIEKLVPNDEVGMDLDKIDWLNHEVKNFKGTLEYLINDYTASKNHFSVEYLRS